MKHPEEPTPDLVTHNSRARRFELHAASSSKFWEVSQNGAKVTTRFGRIGKEDQKLKTKDLGNFKRAVAAIQKLIREKTLKGYIPVSGPVSDVTNVNRPERKGFPSLIEVKNAGVTFLRTTWNGYNDDGFFTHVLFDENRREIGSFSSYETDNIEFEKRLEEEVLCIMTANGFIWHPVSAGSVGDLELDLLSGKGIWRAADADPAARLAEMLLECERKQVVALTATIKVTFIFEDVEGDDQSTQIGEGYLEGLEISVIEIEPSDVDRGGIIEGLKYALRRLDDCESPESMIQSIVKKVGEKIPSSQGDRSQSMFCLSVNVAKRTFAFTGKGKRLL
jgi:predicted DNA-binding WGR domain protein